MAFLADDFGAWLVALASDTGRKKLARFFTGTDEQGRALRAAAATAIQATAQELRPGDPEGAEHLARVIDEFFKTPIRENAHNADATASDALTAAIAAQFAVLDDASMTGVGRTAADELEVSSVELAEKLDGHLRRQIVFSGSRGGPLEPLANELNHETTHHAIKQLASAVEAGFDRQAAARPTGRTAPAARIGALHVEHLLAGLQIGEHGKAEQRMHQLFLPLNRSDQRVIIEALLREATKIEDEDNETRLLACSLIEAANRLDPSLITVEEVEELAASADFTLRSSAAVLLWHWAETLPGRVPVPLLCRLSLPSTEDWYVHAAARAGAKTLLLHRAAARAIFDRMAASRDRDDRDYAVADLLDVAEVERRAVPVDLARKLADDPDKGVAARGAKLVRAVSVLGEHRDTGFYSQFGM